MSNKLVSGRLSYKPKSKNISMQNKKTHKQKTTTIIKVSSHACLLFCFSENQTPPYTSTLRQFQLCLFVGWKRIYLAVTRTGNLCRSIVMLSPFLWNSWNIIYLQLEMDYETRISNLMRSYRYRILHLLKRNMIYLQLEMYYETRIRLICDHIVTIIYINFI